MTIKNIGIFAHVDAGKTTLTEQILYHSGAIREAGSVDSGTARTDTLTVERERGISVRNCSTSVVIGDVRVNIIDTPGHIDFAGETERAFSVLDGAVLVVSAVEGVQSHTENLRRIFVESGVPHIIFVNKIDRAGSSVDSAVSELESLGGSFVRLVNPVSEGEGFCSVEKTGDDVLLEALANFDDSLLEAYIAGEISPREALDEKLAELCASCELTPVLCGAAAKGIGVEYLIDAVVKYLPSAETDRESLSAVVYRIEHESDMGALAHVRLYGGELKSRDDLSVLGVTRENRYTHEREPVEPLGKITQIRVSNGARYTDTGRVTAGDIAALCGEPNLKIGDIIGELPPNYRHFANLANPFLTVCVRPAVSDPANEASELIRLTSALRELSEEEPLINFRWEKTEREAHIDLTGNIQLEIITALLRERYGVEALFTPPTIIYRETPAREGDGFEAYTMPKPCWAVVQFHLEPGERGSGVVYDGGNVPHNQLFYKYQSHIKTSFFDAIAQGLHGWEVTDFKCTLTGGEHHTIHTHPLDFFVATPMAFMNGLQSCGVKLLEPMLKARIRAPEECLGKILGEITIMRGEFDTPVIANGSCNIECILPAATSLEFPIKLASWSAGRSTYAPSFSGWRECPAGFVAETPRRGVNPLDRARWILWARGALK